LIRLLITKEVAHARAWLLLELAGEVQRQRKSLAFYLYADAIDAVGFEGSPVPPPQAASGICSPSAERW